MSTLHTDYLLTPEIRARLAQWDEALASEGPLRANRWNMLALWPVARSVTVSASTGIEGNPLTPSEVDELISGGSVSADHGAIREVLNYNEALDLANRLALRPQFRWNEEIVHRVNAAVMRDLPDDTRGEYRLGPVNVAGTYSPPAHEFVPTLVLSLAEWLNDSDEHGLVRAALLHLNVAAIHPFLDGNGRTARVLTSLDLMRSGLTSVELVNTESYLRAHRDEYFGTLRTTLGDSYQPERHSATPWVEYFTRVAIDRLDHSSRMFEAMRGDVGILVMEAVAAEQPAEWVPILIAARLGPVRTATVARFLDEPTSTARATLARMVRAGWLRAEGNTRARRYLAATRLLEIPLRLPEVVGDSGTADQQLALWGTWPRRSGAG